MDTALSDALRVAKDVVPAATDEVPVVNDAVPVANDVVTVGLDMEPYSRWKLSVRWEILQKKARQLMDADEGN